jgi:hypothetical protein
MAISYFDEAQNRLVEASVRELRRRQRRRVSRRWPRVCAVEVWVSPRSMASIEQQTSASEVFKLKKAVPRRSDKHWPHSPHCQSRRGPSRVA